MVHIKETSLEWSIKHLMKYYDSDFYPKQFEIKAIQSNWLQVKEHILGLDLTSYAPKFPLITLAPKANENYRVVHQLDPIDVLIYTSLVYELSAIIEDFRLPESEKIACSYRIKPDMDGSFFSKDDTGWDNFTSRTEELIAKKNKGYTLICDIADFYNQIYIHRVRNVVAEAGKGMLDEQAKVLENFLLGMNNKNSQGIPVGPAASILLAEAIMADIDKKILYYTRDFVRWVDDIRIFFNKREKAVFVLHELTRYLYSTHRLYFSGEKTFIKPTSEYGKRYFKNEAKEEKEAVLKETEALTTAKMEELLSNISPYEYGEADEEEAYQEAFDEIAKDKHFEILTKAYLGLFKKSLSSEKLNFVMIRHILKKASRYRIRSLLPLVLENFERLIPLTREVVIYINKVINKEIARRHKSGLTKIFETSYIKIPYVNIWLSHLLQNDCFNAIGLPKDYKDILTVRDQALIAYRKADLTWVKDCKDSIDVLGPRDKRAVLFSSLLLSGDEMRVFVESVAAKGDIMDKSIVSYLLSSKK